MSRKEIIGFNDKWLLLLGIPFVALVLSSVLFSDVLHQGHVYFLSLCYPISLAYTIFYWLLFREIMIHLRRRKSMQNNTRRRVAIELILVVGLFLVLKFPLDYLLTEVLSVEQNEFRPNPWLELFTGLIMCLFITSIYEIIYIQKKLEKSILEKEQLTRARIQSQLEGLKTQIQPHFLFNSLNTLAGLIPEDSARAVEYVQKLSSVFRYILDIRNEALIPLEDEVHFLKSYIVLQKERFGENLKVNLQIDPQFMSMMVVPLSLQILFENAIKHNILTREKPLTVRIYINRLGKLTVENNLQPKEVIGSTTRIGLENIKKRYRFVVEETVDIVPTLESFVVSLPLVHPSSIQLS